MSSTGPAAAADTLPASPANPSADARTPSGGRPAPGLQRRYDNFFFSAMAAVALIVVLIGFARTYFLAGLFRAPLPNLLVHVHGAVFTLWILLFIAQVTLVTARRVDLHRRLGLLGFVLALVMIVLGTVAASDRLARHVAQPGKETVAEVRAFYAVPLGDMLIFSTFLCFGYRNRFQPAVHKRLMWFATLSLLDAGFDRWPVFEPYSLPVVNLVCFVPLLLLLMGYDWWSTGKVQRVTTWSALFLVVAQEIRHPLGNTAAWQSFAAWVAMHMPSFS
jgi:hypothetical protein